MSGHGGRRHGAGKPKGYQHQRTLARKIERETLRARLSAEFEPLMTSYLEAAKGAYVMFARDSHGKWTRVTDADTMERCLQSGETFYRLEQSKPDVRALRDALDRLFGKPTQSVDVNAEIDHTQTTKVLHIHQPDACPQCGYKYQDDAMREQASVPKTAARAR
jgi:predicted Zn-ribbon and HTH transcriptional regulator